MKYVMLPLKDATAKEYATQGFPRRLGVMAHCIHNVFTTLPPDKEEIPSKTQLFDTTVNIQAFLVNAFGCIDNLARIRIHEKPVTTERGGAASNGNPLQLKCCKANAVWFNTSCVLRKFQPASPRWL